MGEEREVMTWPLFGEGSRELAAQVADDRYYPDVIIAIARGGLTVAGALAYALSVKNCSAINVEYYTGIDERLEVPVLLPPALDLIDIKDEKVLLVDDVADTGHTLAMVQEVLAPSVQEVRTAVLYRKPRSVVAPEYVWRHTDLWIDFPWSSLPPVDIGHQERPAS
jgi:hypoxanthine phosphoribosyltransferase